jgi:hypothetical protein
MAKGNVQNIPQAKELSTASELAIDHRQVGWVVEERLLWLRVRPSEALLIDEIEDWSPLMFGDSVGSRLIPAP